eukprot:15155604-Alexandrium_andersonii.AAC.1
MVVEVGRGIQPRPSLARCAGRNRRLAHRSVCLVCARCGSRAQSFMSLWHSFEATFAARPSAVCCETYLACAWGGAWGGACSQGSPVSFLRGRGHMAEVSLSEHG